jgi:hypothetical protein
VQATTRIKYVTDGLLLREMMDDPLLTKYRSALYSIQIQQSNSIRNQGSYMCAGGYRGLPLTLLCTA